MKKGFIMMLVLSLVFVMALTGCNKTNNTGEENAVNQPDSNTEAPATNDAEPASEGNMDDVQEYIFAHPSVITSLDPHKVGSIPAWQVQGPIYENLVRYVALADGSAKYEPGVAESWSVSDDG